MVAKAFVASLLLVLGGAGASFRPAFAHEGEIHMVCKKKDKVVKVKGKTDGEKRKACAAAGGEWVEDKSQQDHQE